MPITQKCIVRLDQAEFMPDVKLSGEIGRNGVTFSYLKIVRITRENSKQLIN